MNRSSSIKEITAALIAFQKQVPLIEKTHNATERGRNYKYATLADVQEVVRDPLTSNGLNIVQMPDGTGIVTILSHISGEWIESFYEFPTKNITPQGLGSTITYMRRYALAAMLNLCIDGDDDGVSGAELTALPIKDGKVDMSALAKRVRNAPAKRSTKTKPKPINMP